MCLSGSTERVRVRATLATQVPLDRFEVVVNGEPVKTAPGERAIDRQIPLSHSSWIAARAIARGAGWC